MRRSAAKKIIFLTAMFLVFRGSDVVMSQIEIPEYKIIQSKDSIELREYAPMIQAEVLVSGERKKAINDGFRLLADYIFGNNISKTSIAMTAPVNQQKSEKIAMTAPVTQSKEGQEWKVQFTMPSSYTLDTLPKPNNPKVKIVSKPACLLVVIRFSGFWSERSLQKHLAELNSYAQAHQLETVGEPMYAFYNPPWTLPFMRRNEISYIVRKTP